MKNFKFLLVFFVLALSMNSCQKDAILSEEANPVNLEEVSLLVKDITSDNFVVRSMENNLVSQAQWEEILTKVNNGEELDLALRVITNDEVRENALTFFKKASIRYEELKEDLKRDPKLLEKAVDSEVFAISRGGDCEHCDKERASCNRGAGRIGVAAFGTAVFGGLTTTAYTLNPVPFYAGFVIGIVGGGFSYAAIRANCSDSFDTCVDICKSRLPGSKG